MRTAILYNFLLEANIMASIAIVLMMILRKFFRKPLGNSVLSFGWLLIAIRLLLPISLPNPFIYTIRTPYAPDEAIRPIAGQIQVRLKDFFEGIAMKGPGPGQGTLIQQSAEDLRNGIINASLPITLSKIYLAGIILVVIWFVIINVRFRRQLKADRIESISGTLLEDYQALCQRLKVKELPVYLIDPLPSACLVGVFRPSIALPLTVSPKDALHVLRHELGHYQNRDQVYGVLRLLCCALHWFNPLVWLAAHMSYTDSELRTDERVIAAMEAPEKQAYANVLVLSAARHSAPGLSVLATGMTQTHKKLKARVKGILNNKKPVRWLAVAFVLIASMSLLSAFATHEATLAPRLNRLSPALTTQNIQTDEQAIAYAKELLSRNEMGLNLRDDLKWEIIENEVTKGQFIVAGNYPDEDRAAQSVSFDERGRMYFIANHASSWEPGFTSAFLAISPQDMKALGDDLLAYLRLMNPEEAIAANIWLTEQLRVGDDIYINFTFADQDDKNFDWRYGQIPVATVTVQVAPVVRVIRMNFNPNPLDGNG